MKSILRIVRNGEIRLKFPASMVTEKADGTLWVQGNPLLGVSDPEQKTALAALVRAKKWSEIPAEAYVKLGDNSNGVWAGYDDDWENNPAKLAADKASAEASELAKRTRIIHLCTRGWGDFSPVEWLGDIERPENEIVAECRALLHRAHDVDHVLTDDQILAAVKEAKAKPTRAEAEPETKHGPGYCYNCQSYCYGDCGRFAPERTAETLRRELDDANREENFGMED